MKNARAKQAKLLFVIGKYANLESLRTTSTTARTSSQKVTWRFLNLIVFDYSESLGLENVYPGDKMGMRGLEI